jgi:hypothetical protein
VHGPMKFPSGIYYEGMWRKGTTTFEGSEREGRGLAIYSDGEVYEGYWLDGDKYGCGR